MRRDQAEWKKHGKVNKNNTVVKTERETRVLRDNGLLGKRQNGSQEG